MPRSEKTRATMQRFFDARDRRVRASARAGVKFCVVCGCTDDRACVGGCSWVDDWGPLDRCSNCGGKPQRYDAVTGRRLR